MTETDVKKYIEEMQDLSTIPVLLTRIVRTCNDPKSTPRDIINLVTYDPALAERILRIANSTFFGHSGQVKNLYHAVMLLGIERIKALALGLTVLHALPGGGAMTATNIWMHGYEVAYLASSFAQYLPDLMSGDCFLAGLLHDIGRIVFLGMAPDRFRQLAAADDLAAREAEVFGCTHADAGALLIEKLGLPGDLIAPVQYHHTPLSADTAQNLVAAVSLAEALTGLRKSRPEEDGNWTQEHDALAKRYRIPGPVLEGVYDDLLESRDEIEGIFMAV